MVIRGYDVGTLLKKTGREIWRDNLLGLSAQTAYSLFFSLFPILLFLAPLISIIGNEQQIITTAVNRLTATLPEEADQLFRGVVQDVVFSEEAPGLLSIGIVLAIFSASAVVSAMIGALNTAYGVKDPRPWWKTRLVAMAFTVAGGVIVIAVLAVVFAGQQILDFFVRYTRLTSDAAAVWRILQYPIAFLTFTGFITLTYLFLPYVKQDIRKVVVGSIIAVLLWVLITYGFRLYVVHFADYNKTYGTIGGVIILLTWLYLCMFVILAGGELISELHQGTGRTQMDTHADDTPEPTARTPAPREKPTAKNS